MTSHSYCLNQQDSSRPTERAKGNSRGDQPGVLMNPAINFDCDSGRGPSQVAVVARPRGTRGPATARCVLKIQVSRALSDAGSVRDFATDGAGFGGRCHATRPNGPASRMAQSGSDAMQSEKASASDEERVRWGRISSPVSSDLQERPIGQPSGTSMPRQLSRPEIRLAQRSVASGERRDVSKSGPPDRGAVRNVTSATTGRESAIIASRTET